MVEEKEPEMPWSQITFLSCHTHTVVALMSYFLYLFFPWEVNEKSLTARAPRYKSQDCMGHGTRTAAAKSGRLHLPNRLGLDLSMENEQKTRKKIYSLIQHYSILDILQLKLLICE